LQVVANQNRAAIWQTCKEHTSYQFAFITATLFGWHGNVPWQYWKTRYRSIICT